MPVTIDTTMCIGCAACVGNCPTESLDLNDEGHAAVNEDTCIDCGACVDTCPVGAITL